MKNLIRGAILTGAMMAASPALAATTVNVNATVNNPITVALDAGSYAVSLVKGTYTAWAPAVPAGGNWTDYYQYTINGTTTIVNPLNSVRFATPDAAFNAYSAFGPSMFTLNAATNVTFNVVENPGQYGDNAGGVSLNIAAVPEPATWLMMIVGFLAVAAAMRSARNGRGAAVTA